MKRNILNTIKTLLMGAAFVFTLASCGMSDMDESDSGKKRSSASEKATISISCNTETSRTARPDDVDEADYSKVVLYAKEKGADDDDEILLKKWESDTQKTALEQMSECESLPMEVGEYTFTLNLYAKTNLYKPCQSGTLDKKINPGKNTLAFSTKYTNYEGGTGFVYFQPYWSKSIDVAKVCVDFYKIDENLDSQATPELSVTPFDKEKASDPDVTELDVKYTLTSGNYNVLVTAFDSEESEIFSGNYGVVVANECNTYFSFELNGDRNRSLILVIHRFAKWANGTGKIRHSETEEFVLPSDKDLLFDGYVLTGWNTEADGSGIYYDVGDDFRLSEDLTLYAQFAKYVNVTFVDRGNEYTVKVLYNSKLQAPEDYFPDEDFYTRPDDYNDCGWFYANGSLFSPRDIVKEDVVITRVLLKGSGSENYPYLLGTVGDWNNFELLTRYASGPKIYVKMEADIGTDENPVTTMLGNFYGIFNGNEKKLTVSFDEKNCTSDSVTAPFSKVDSNSEIRNLTVKGSVKADGGFVSGLVGELVGKVVISDCLNSVDVVNTSKEGRVAGFIAKHNSVDQKAVVDNCIFDGKLTAEKGSESAGFVYRASTGGAIFTSCAFAPESVNVDASNSYTFMEATTHSSTQKVTFNTPCYYTEAIGDAQVTKAYKNFSDAPSICLKWELFTGKPYYEPCDFELNTINYAYTGSKINPSYSLSYDGEDLTEKTEFTLQIKNADGDDAELKDEGEYTLVFEGVKNKGYYGTITKKVYIVAEDYSLEGTGTGADPFKIKSIADWVFFSEQVKSGTTYASQCLRLMNNLGSEENPVTVMIGDETHPFCGIFEGNGYYIYVDYDDSTATAAPFLYTKRESNENRIEGLEVRGRIRNSNCAGLVYTAKDTKLSSCVVSAVLGNPDSVRVSGFVDNGDCGFTDCFFDPSEIIQVRGDSYTIIAHNDYQWPVYYYYTEPLSVVQGERAYESPKENAFSKYIHPSREKAYYFDAKAVISGVEDTYSYNDSGITITPDVKILINNNFTLTNAKEYNFRIEPLDSSGSVNESGDTILAPGSYALVFEANPMYYNGTITKIINVTASALSGSGTSDDPYTIGSDADWLTFCDTILAGKTYDGEYVKLTSDIGSESNPCTATNLFAGNFDGDNHTFTVDINDTGSSGTGVFGHVKTTSGMVIKNLTVKGSVKSSMQDVGSLIGLIESGSGSVTIENCMVSASVKTTISSDKANLGGFIGGSSSLKSGATIKFKNCLFNGKLIDENGKGGCFGFAAGTARPVFENCIFAPEEVSVNSNGSGVFADYVDTTKSTDYFYTEYFGEKNQGSKAYTSEEFKEGLGLCKKITHLDGKDYYAVYTLSNLPSKALYKNGSNIQFTPSFAIGTKDVLRSTTDYSITVKKSSGEEVPNTEIKDVGKYTAYFESVASSTKCVGSCSYSFEVVPTLEGEGTETAPYLIGDTVDWEIFARLVNEGLETFSGKYVKLTNNIGYLSPVTTIVGMDDTNCFKGNLDGDDHTVCVPSYVFTQATDYSVLFKLPESAVIENLSICE